MPLFDQQATVAVFRQTGQGVDVAHGPARLIEWFEQRIGKPLRKLVKGHQTIAAVFATQGRMHTDIAQRLAIDSLPAWPDWRQNLQQGGQQSCRVVYVCRQKIEQVAEPA